VTSTQEHFGEPAIPSVNSPRPRGSRAAEARITTTPRVLWVTTWATAGVLWFVYVYARRADLGYALLAAGVVAAGVAAFAAGAWRMASVITWRRGRRLLAFLAHVVCAHLFALALAAVCVWVTSVHDGVAPRAVVSYVAVELHLAIYLSVALYGISVLLAYWSAAEQDLRARELRLAQAEAEAAHERLRALRAQLNPHFLLNALHAVGSLVPREPALAQRGLDQLGHLLRYVLDGLDDEHTALGDELDFVRDYLALERLRLGARLEIVCDIDDETLDCAVPPFALHVLVENAIKHGIAPRREGGRLSIRTWFEAGQVRASVSDDGPGTGAPHASPPGIGLRNLRRQLETRYGSAATLELCATPGLGFKATLGLPIAAVPGRTCRPERARHEPASRVERHRWPA
jgi:signal transduction histidine kinase